MSKKIVILGAGLTGLSAAYKLSEENIDVEVIESQPIVGGLAASTKHGEFILDYGPHSFYTNNDKILEQVRKLLDSRLESVVRKTKIYLQGKFFYYPLMAKDICFRLNYKTSIRTLLDYVTIRVKRRVRPSSDANFEDWIVNRFGRYLYRIFFQPYNEKLWGISPDRLSAHWAKTRIAPMGLRDAIFSLFSRRKLPDGARFIRDAHLLYYPKNGIGQISQSLAAKIAGRRNGIHLGCCVQKVELLSNGRIEVSYEDGSGIKKIMGDLVISTIPITNLVRILIPKINGTLLAVAKNLKFRSLIFVYLFTNKEKILDVQYIYFMDRFFHRVTEFKQYSLTTCPPNKSSLGIEIACNKGDDIWQSTDEELFKRCIRDIKRAGIISREEVEHYLVKRLPYAYPLYEVGYHAKVDELINYFVNVKNLILAGRQGTFTYLDMDQSMEEGFKAARKAIARL